MTMYVLLGVQESATEHQIRAAYRTLARRYHPDVSRTPDAKRFARIQQAYNVLGSAVQRLEYDAWLRDSREGEKKAVATIPKSPPVQEREAAQELFSVSGLSTPLRTVPKPANLKGSRIRDWFTGPEPEASIVVWG